MDKEQTVKRKKAPDPGQRTISGAVVHVLWRVIATLLAVCVFLGIAGGVAAVRVYEKGNRGHQITEEDGDGFYYWTDALRIEEPGEYTVDAVIVQNNEDDWEHPLPVDGTRTTKDITVNATEKTLGNPVVYVTPY